MCPHPPPTQPLTAHGAASAVNSIAQFGYGLSRVLLTTINGAKSQPPGELTAILRNLQATASALDLVYLHVRAQRVELAPQRKTFAPAVLNSIFRTAARCLFFFWSVENRLLGASGFHVGAPPDVRLGEFRWRWSAARWVDDEGESADIEVRLSADTNPASLLERLHDGVLEDLAEYSGELQSLQAALNVIAKVMALGQRTRSTPADDPESIKKDANILSFTLQQYRSEINLMIDSGRTGPAPDLPPPVLLDTLPARQAPDSSDESSSEEKKPEKADPSPRNSIDSSVSKPYTPKPGEDPTLGIVLPSTTWVSDLATPSNDATHDVYIRLLTSYHFWTIQPDKGAKDWSRCTTTPHHLTPAEATQRAEAIQQAKDIRRAEIAKPRIKLAGPPRPDRPLKGLPELQYTLGLRPEENHEDYGWLVTCLTETQRSQIRQLFHQLQTAESDANKRRGWRRTGWIWTVVAVQPKTSLVKRVVLRRRSVGALMVCIRRAPLNDYDIRSLWKWEERRREGEELPEPDFRVAGPFRPGMPPPGMRRPGVPPPGIAGVNGRPVPAGMFMPPLGVGRGVFPPGLPCPPPTPRPVLRSMIPLLAGGEYELVNRLLKAWAPMDVAEPANDGAKATPPKPVDTAAALDVDNDSAPVPSTDPPPYQGNAPVTK